MTKHTPATPLPMERVDRIKELHQLMDISPLGFPVMVERLERERAQLVSALRDCIKADEMRAFERGQREPEFQRYTEHPASALLRELGEDA